MTDEPGLRDALEPGPMREWFSDLIAGASLNTPPGWVHLTPVEVSRLHAWLARTPAASDGSLDVARLARALGKVGNAIEIMTDEEAAEAIATEYAKSASEGKTE